jgi:hypothetical protein
MLLFTALLAGSLYGVPAAAQVPVPIGLTVPPFNPGEIQPLQEPRKLGIFHVPAFRFAAETINTGIPLPGTPNRFLAKGGGTVVRGPRTTGWTLVVEHIVIDGLVLAAGAPLVTLTVSVENDAPAQRFYNAEYRGLETLPQGAPGSPIRRIVRGMADTLAFALPMLPSQPIAERSPVLDLN